MKYLALLTIVDAELNGRVRPDHLRYISALYEQGKVFQAGPFPDGSGGLVIYHNLDEPDLRALAEADPVITSGARTLTWIPWHVLELPIARES